MGDFILSLQDAVTKLYRCIVEIKMKTQLEDVKDLLFCFLLQLHSKLLNISGAGLSILRLSV